VCHSHIHLDQLVQDEAGRELLATLVSVDAELGRWAVQYIGLWRPAKSDLSNVRAARLLKETLAMTDDKLKLCSALQTTVSALHKKRQAGENLSALDSHTYLKRVIDTTVVSPEVSSNVEQDDGDTALRQHPALKAYKPPTAVGPDARRPNAAEQEKIAALLANVRSSLTKKTKGAQRHDPR
jgi:hypothetical protein